MFMDDDEIEELYLSQLRAERGNGVEATSSKPEIPSFLLRA